MTANLDTLPAEKGAKFYKCDFQIHSPRDSAWTGSFSQLEEREAWAKALISDCRRNGLHAIAITDHHDLCAYKLARKAAAEEIDSQGNAVLPGDRLVVFPGIELTLATPSCQALLIFEPNTADEILSLVLGALRIAPTPDENLKTTITQHLNPDLSLNEIDKTVGQLRTNPTETNPKKFEYLSGKYILLPNVKKNGHQNILRDGFQSHFISMNCVGGYIEGVLYGDLEQGNRNKIEGKTLEWGSKALGVFQTSDCRKATPRVAGGVTIVEFENLGRWPTWVKWSKPTAEALRQACLAKKSRISHQQPTYPKHQIIGVRVTDSAFLGRVELGLNPQYNAFIGGRGTGKSSLLEYIRWGLCDTPQNSENEAELPDFEARRRSLIEGTLRPKNAVVSVYYKKNDVVYRIDRALSSKTETLTVTSTDGTAKQSDPDYIRREFPIVSYAQKQLSSVGTLPEEINRLIIAPVQDEISSIQLRINSELIPKLKEQRIKEKRAIALSKEIESVQEAIKSRREQIQALQSGLNALTPEQQKVLAEHESITRGYQAINGLLEIAKQTGESLDSILHQLEAHGTFIPEVATNQTETALLLDLNNFHKELAEVISGLIAKCKSESWISPETSALVAGTIENHTHHIAEYKKCLESTSQNQNRIKEIQNLNKFVNDQETRLSSLKVTKATLESRVETTQILYDELKSLIDERGAILAEQCESLNAQTEHEFRAHLKKCGESTSTRLAIEAIVEGKGVKDSETKVIRLVELIHNDENPMAKWKTLVEEIEALVESRGRETVVDTPLLSEAGFTEANINAFKNSLSMDLLEQFRFLNIEDSVEFLFRSGVDESRSPRYIPFAAASPGQHATCLFRTLLSKSGAPLLIDQPEEDLDNEQIQVLSDKITETKTNRQLIFVSHNANIVVNGDADLVVSFGYSDPGNNSRGCVTHQGSIDERELRDRITSVMEGGREAFDLRKRKYGF